MANLTTRVEAMGLEPTTSTLQRSHSSQLSYAPVGDRTGLSSIVTVPADLGTIADPALFASARRLSDQGLRGHRHMPPVRSLPRRAPPSRLAPTAATSLRSEPLPAGRAVDGVPLNNQEYPCRPPTVTTSSTH